MKRVFSSLKQLLLYSSLVQLWVILLIVSVWCVSHLSILSYEVLYRGKVWGNLEMVEMVLPEFWISDKVPGKGAF